MGAIVAKAQTKYHAAYTKEQEVRDLWDDVRLGVKNKARPGLLAVKFVEIHTMLNVPRSSRATRAHMKVCSSLEPTAASTLRDLIISQKDEILLRALCSVCDDIAKDHTNAQHMREEGMKQILIKLAEESLDDEFVLTDIRSTFKSIKQSTEEQGTEMIEEARTSTKDINSIYAAMRNQPRSASMQVYGLTAMAEICRSKEVAQTVLNVDGGPKPVFVTMCRYNKNSEIQVLGYQIIAMLAKASNEVSGLMGRSGAISVIAGSLNAAQTLQRRNLQQDIFSLNELGRCRKNKDRLIKERIGLVLRRAQRVLRETQLAESIAEAERAKVSPTIH